MSIERFCWDADVFIAILKGNDPDRTPDELQALREAVAAFDAGRIIVVAPTTIYSEVLDPLRDGGVRERLEAMMRRSNFVIQDITQEIGRASGVMRHELQEKGLSLRTPDSQYIATALIHRCHALHSFDERLHRLSGMPEVRGLRICTPKVEQTELDLA